MGQITDRCSDYELSVKINLKITDRKFMQDLTVKITDNMSQLKERKVNSDTDRICNV